MKGYEQILITCVRFCEEDVIATSNTGFDTPPLPIDSNGEY